jgi:general secretion pathway protein D
MRTLATTILAATLTGVVLLTPGHISGQAYSAEPAASDAKEQPASGSPPSEKPKASPKAQPVEVVKNSSGVKIKLNFQDAPLQTVLEYLSETAGLMIVSDEPLVNGRITVISREPILLDEAVSLINSILKEKSLTTVLTGKTLKVVTLQNAKKENIPVLTGRDPDAIVPGDDVVTYVVPVSHVTASALKSNLQTLLPEYAGLEANEDGNALIITDTTANIKRLMEIVRALDTYMSTVAEIRVFRLINADATSAANLINNIFQQEQQSGTRSQQGARGPFEMMMQMGAGGPGGRGSSAGRSGGDTGSNQGGTSVNVQVVAAADTRTNAVVVRGPAEALEIVADMIKALDDRTATLAGVRVFQLRHADALNVAEIINQLFGESAGSSGSQQDRGPTFFMRGGPGGPGALSTTQQEETGSTLKVTAAADSRTNTVAVTGPDNVLEVVAEVVKNLDSQIPNVADVKVFHLEYADAQDTAELINEVFGESGTSSQTTRSTGQQNQQVQFMRGGPGGFPGQQQTTQGSSTSDVTIIASADSRTNSVVVSGPPETLVIITQVVKELDENPEQERRIFVYALKNANAENLMDILNNLFTEMQTLNEEGTSSQTGQQFQGGQRGAAAAMPTASSSASASSESTDISEETYFQADPNTNSLLIMTSSKNYEKIKPIIDELDKPVGQVLIKVLFAEVTHSDTVDLGTEFSMLNLRSGGGSTETTQVFGKPTSLLTEAGLSRPTGVSVRTIEGDLDITLRALQETGKLNVLSRPYILTRNNQLATITVGEEVPIPTGTTTVAGQTQTTIEYRDDIGIVLDVTPSINPDGLVNMVVSPKITTRSTETVPISETLNAQAFATRSAQTRVAVHDGQTIVIGGLIEDQMKDTVTKIPLLGDVPLVGNLFKRTIKEKTKTELLIFLTPHVAQEARDLTAISDAERARSNLNSDGPDAELFRKHMEAMNPTRPDVKDP